MGNSIFKAIKSYIPSEKRNPEEDYLTQLFAWLLENIEGMSFKFWEYLNDKLDADCSHVKPSGINIETQFNVGIGRVDMLLHTEDKGFMFEHKVWSQLSDRQIQKYQEAIESAHPKTWFTILITALKSQHTQKADISLVWRDIYQFFEQRMNDYRDTDLFLISQFMKYLDEHNLGPINPISPEQVLSYIPALDLEHNLDSIFHDLKEQDWTAKCPNIARLQANGYKPTFNSKRWGRKGIDFYSSWKPGLFAGVLLDGGDHQLKLDHPELVVFVEIQNLERRPVGKIYNTIQGAPEFKMLCENITLKVSGFEFISGFDKSNWRILVLRKSLLDVISGCKARDEQVDIISEWLVKGINLLIEDLAIVEIVNKAMK